MKTIEQIMIMLNMEIERKKLADTEQEKKIIENRISILNWVLNKY